MKYSKSKRILFLVVWFVLPMLSFGSDQAQALFAKGNAYYAKAQYKDALTIYQQILGEGYQSAALYFNMGNASFKSDDIPAALLYFEKAHKLAPGDEDINYNIRFANLKTVDKIDEAPEFFLANWWKAFILSLSVGTLTVLSILLVMLASVIFIIYFFANSVSIKRSSFYASIVLFLLGVLTIFMTGMQISYFDNHRQGIIFASSVTIKSGPVDKSGSLFVLHDGTKVNILENNNGWMKIRLGNGNEGWIKAGDVKEI